MAVLVWFIVLQVLDGILTYCGITHTSLGLDYEGNYLLVLLAIKVGVSTALILFKGVSIGIGWLIFKYCRDQKMIMHILLFLNGFLTCIVLEHMYALLIIYDVLHRS